MKRLYRVELEYEVYILAEDEDDAEWEAQHVVETEHIEPSQQWTDRVFLTDISSYWLNERPWGDNGNNMTCKEILEAEKAEAEEQRIIEAREKAQLKLPLANRQ